MNKFKQKTRLYKVYHIRECGNTDITQGYVGITRRSLAWRLSQHFQSRKPVGQILRQLGKNNVEIIQLAMMCKEDALEMEYSLRPILNMGWNVMAGGNKPTVKCPLCGKYLPKRKTGAYCMKCRDTRFSKGHIPHNYGKGEKYKLISPNGEIFTPDVFTVFCREHNLTPQNLRKVAKGRRKHHKGWIAMRIEG